MDALQHLAHSWLLAPPGRGYFAVMADYTHEFYADDSGSRRDTVTLSASGFLAPVERWDEFKLKWNQVKNEFGISGPFHAHLFATCKGEFEVFKGKANEQRRFIRKLIQVLRDHAVYGAAASVVLSDYKAVNDIYLLDDAYGGPYPLCARLAIMWVDKWTEQHPEVKVKFIFEDGAHGNDALFRVMHEEGRGSEISFLKKEDHPALEAGDFSAWERTRVLRKVIQRRQSGQTFRGEADVRKSLRFLWREIPYDANVETRATLLDLCQRGNVPLRKPTRPILVK